MEGGAGWNQGWGWGGVRGEWGGDTSLNVAAVEGVALKVSVDILHAWQLHPVLVHTPADATLAATGRLALLSLVESFAIAVGQVHGPGHHAWASFELLQGSLHVSAAGALLRFLSHLRCSDDAGVSSVLSSPHKLGLGQLLSAVLLHGLSLQLGDAGVLGPEDLGGIGLLGHLGGGGVLMLLGVSLDLDLLAVALFVEANPAAVQQGVQRLLLVLPGEAAQPLGAALSVDAARLPLRQGASHAAAAARLLDQLAAQGAGGAHGEGFLVAGLAVHEGAQALGRSRTGGQQQEDRGEHHLLRISPFTLGRGRRMRVLGERGQEGAQRFFFLNFWQVEQVTSPRQLQNVGRDGGLQRQVLVAEDKDSQQVGGKEQRQVHAQGVGSKKQPFQARPGQNCRGGKAPNCSPQSNHRNNELGGCGGDGVGREKWICLKNFCLKFKVHPPPF